MSSSWRRALYLLLVIGVFLGAWSYYFPDSAIGGVVMNKVNTYRLNQGLVGWWTFDGTDVNFQTNRATDRSGQGHHGEMWGMSTSTSRVAGKVGQALHFDGVDDEIDLDDYNPWELSSSERVTLSLWLNTDTYKEANIFGRDNGDWTINLWTWMLCLNDDMLSFGIGTGAQNQFKTFYELPLNTWKHVVVVVGAQGEDIRFYIDGELLTSETLTRTLGQLRQTANEFSLGGQSIRYFDGSLDDVRMWNRALSASEVKLLYTSTAGSKMNTSKNVIPGSTLQTGLVGLWSFDGPDLDFRTNRAIDRSGQGNNGEMVNMSTSTSRVAGKVGQALQFDGVDDEVRSPDPFVGLDSTAAATFTWSWWQKTNQDNNGHMIGWGSGRFCYMGFISGYVACTVDSDANGGVISLTTLADNQWHHVVYTHSPGSQTLYVDGVLNDTANETFVTGAGDIDVGVRPFGIYWQGALDDVRIYNRALSAQEVKLLYTSTAGSKMNTSQNVVPGSSLQTGLVGLWSFNGKDMDWRNGLALDRSGQGNDGTLLGGMHMTSSPVAGKVGQAMQFGLGNVIDIGVDASTDMLGPMSASFWMNARSDGEGSRGHVLWKRGATWGNGWSIAIYGTNDTMEFWVDYDGASDLSAYSALGSFTTGKWDHWVVAWDGTTSGAGVIFYKNGVAVIHESDQNGAGGRTDDTDSALYLGNNVDSNRTFDGSLDEVRIYNRALTPAEVKLLYNLGR